MVTRIVFQPKRPLESTELLLSFILSINLPSVPVVHSLPSIYYHALFFLIQGGQSGNGIFLPNVCYKFQIFIACLELLLFYTLIQNEILLQGSLLNFYMPSFLNKKEYLLHFIHGAIRPHALFEFIANNLNVVAVDEHLLTLKVLLGVCLTRLMFAKEDVCTQFKNIVFVSDCLLHKVIQSLPFAVFSVTLCSLKIHKAGDIS